MATSTRIAAFQYALEAVTSLLVVLDRVAFEPAEVREERRHTIYSVGLRQAFMAGVAWEAARVHGASEGAEVVSRAK